jgi:hypothetical protein
VNGVAYSIRATHPACSSGSPIQAFRPSGAATSSAKKVPSDLPMIRHQVRQLPIGLVVRAVRVRDVVASVDGCTKRVGQRTRQPPDADEIVQRVTVREFPDGERRSSTAHGGNIAATREPSSSRASSIGWRSEISSPHARAMFLIATVRFRIAKFLCFLHPRVARLDG